MGKYRNVETNRVSSSGGCVKLTLTDSNSTQLASHPCRKMWIMAENGDDVQFSIGEDVSTANYGVLPQGAAAGIGGTPLELPIENTNLVRVKGENTDVVYYWWVA